MGASPCCCREGQVENSDPNSANGTVSVLEWQEQEIAFSGLSKVQLAALSGNLRSLQQCRQHGDRLNEKDEAGQTIAHLAARKGHVNILTYLRKEGVASMEEVDSNGCTPAHVAAAGGQVQVLKFLKEAGVSLNAKDYDGSTPAHFATLNEDERVAIEVLKYLHHSGASLEEGLLQEENCGWTPAHLAASLGALDVLTWLRDSGVAITRKTQKGTTVAHLAALSENQHVSKSRYVDMLRSLRKAGMTLAEQDNDGWAPAHLAASFGHMEALQMLSQAGASLRTCTNQGLTPAHLAAENGQVDILRYLRDAGVSLSTPDKEGLTPAHRAIFNDNEEAAVAVLRCLDEFGVSLEDMDVNGFTPAHLAAEYRHMEVLQYLQD